MTRMTQSHNTTTASATRCAASATRAGAEPAACFAKGTLVHTREGLVPIEKIEVGDWVLSQPEAQGERAYKRVAKTFSFDDKAVFLVRFHKTGPGEDSMNIEQVAVTGNHPFWLDGRGWVRADHLDFGDHVELHDGSRAFVICSERVYAMPEAGVAWAMAAWGLKANDWSGNRVEFRDGAISVELEQSAYPGEFDDPEKAAFKATVFNLVVEDFHTYYVGAMGAWVHDTRCAAP